MTVHCDAYDCANNIDGKCHNVSPIGEKAVWFEGTYTGLWRCTDFKEKETENDDE